MFLLNGEIKAKTVDTESFTIQNVPIKLNEENQVD